MGDIHFWDNGVNELPTDKNCKVVFETVDGIVKSTPLITMSDAMKILTNLKIGKQAVKCDAIRVVDGREESFQSFQYKVIEVNGQKVII